MAEDLRHHGDAELRDVAIHHDFAVNVRVAEPPRWLRDRLAPYQRPRSVFVMDLPTSADLKVKRRLVAELVARCAAPSRKPG